MNYHRIEISTSQSNYLYCIDVTTLITEKDLARSGGGREK